MRYLLSILLLYCAPLALGQANTTYFVAANGSDSNNGTNKTTPFKNAPGMSGCSANCATADTALQANASGSRIILRGGDTYHYSVNTSNSTNTFMNGTWHLEHYSGGSGSCQLNEMAGAIVKTTCFYTGTDPTWFSGGSFTRPILSGDNSFSTSWVMSCSHNDDGNNLLFWGSYSILDDFEESGFCFGTNSTSAYNQQVGPVQEISNMYIHGWTVVNEVNSVFPFNITTGQYEMIETSGGGTTFLLMDHNIFDGTDSSDGTYTNTSAGFASGYVGCGVGTVIEYNVWRHVENGCVEASYRTVHDNLFEYMFNQGSQSMPGPSGMGDEHGNILESQDIQPTYAPTIYFYNNTVRHNGEGLGVALWPNVGGAVYIFNDILFDDPNCGLWTPGSTTGAATNFLITNTTFGDASVGVNSNNNTMSNIAQTFENNHFVAWTSANTNSWATFVGSSNISMSSATATSQGYTVANNYQPTSGSNSTIHAGTNLSSSCATYSFDSDLCSGTSGGETSTASSGVLSGLLVSPQPSRGSTFDAGAYQFGSITTISPTSNNYMSVAVGSSSSNVTFTLTNNSSSTVTGITITNVGGNTGDFVNAGTGTCSSTLSASASCTIIYYFHPASTGSRSTTLNVADSDSSSPQQATLTGTGTSPLVGASSIKSGIRVTAGVSIN